MPDPIPAEAEQRCEAINEFTILRCKHDADVIVTTGCVHEHIGSKSACWRHAAGLAAGRVGCWVCREIDGHFCSMNVITEVATGA